MCGNSPKVLTPTASAPVSYTHLQARQVYHVAPSPVFQYPGTAAHYVRVDVYGVDGVCHADAVVVAKDVSDISRIALGAVTDKDFAGFQIDAAGA